MPTRLGGFMDAGTLWGLVAMLLVGAALVSVVCVMALSGRISRGRGE